MRDPQTESTALSWEPNAAQLPQGHLQYTDDTLSTPHAHACCRVCYVYIALDLH